MNSIVFTQEAFGTIPKQVHITLGDKFYRVFGSGASRYAREVTSSTRQPIVRGKRLLTKILVVTDEYCPTY